MVLARKHFFLLSAFASLILIVLWVSNRRDEKIKQVQKLLGKLEIEKEREQQLISHHHSELDELQKLEETLDLLKVDDSALNTTDTDDGGNEDTKIYDVVIDEITSINNTTQETDKIIIIMWSDYYEVKGDVLLERIYSGRRWDSECCAGVEVTQDRSQLENASAVVIFSYFTNLQLNDFPKTRRPDQLWVLFGKESPAHTPYLEPFNGMFNWTMTYRRDSEIWAPYGEYLELDQPKDEIDINGIPVDDWISGKSKLLTGVISHCTTASKREKYVEYLRKTALKPVDIFGSCGQYICPRNDKSCNETAFWTDLAIKYKFYFAAENAICIDYITEKFWRALEIGMVPVTYGGGDYKAIAPPGSFIDSRNFPSPKALAEYLVMLDKSPEEYRKYFEWRKKYTIRMGEGWQGWCSLCSKVTKYKRALDKDPSLLPLLSHSYDQLGLWWSNKPKSNKEHVCKGPLVK